MYLSKKEKKIQEQEKLIERLIEENLCLKEQVEKYEANGLDKKMKYVDEQMGKLEQLILETKEYKKEYLRLNREMAWEIRRIRGINV